MVIDTSALISILLKEPDRDRYIRTIANNHRRLLSAANFIETSIVIESRLGEAAAPDLDLLIYKSEIEIIAVDKQQADIARVAYRKYGKNRHPAKLNFGDCFAYALAKVSDEPLLFKGTDFSKTDADIVNL